MKEKNTKLRVPKSRLLYSLVLLCILIVTCVSTAMAMTLNSASITVSSNGGTGQVPLSLDTTPEGLSGYNISITVTNPSIAEIVLVEFPPWVSVSEHSSLPAGMVWLKGLDLQGVITEGSTLVPLGMLTVKGKAAGTTGLSVTVQQMDDDQGAAIIPYITIGTITVTSSGENCVGSSGISAGAGAVTTTTASIQTVTSPVFVTTVTTDGIPTAPANEIVTSPVPALTLTESEATMPQTTQASLPVEMCIFGIVIPAVVIGWKERLR
jgi:hypothetical protein